ncbi:hypothetical protein HYALB_00000197 [Hymenoscyphus albidus]|uniref:Cytochrome P450 n=1 Tax=Hymenoscyphus albidus TaxID=595503 RepID=A0A9N9LSI5_9HELO|nr:hypothetical protein HYALB_00000197 [Hymenoscyphus albidus]
MDVLKIASEHWVLTSPPIRNLQPLLPLAKYSGPFLSKISSIPNFYHNLTGYRHIWLWQCHQIYGAVPSEVFRYEPNGLLFDTPTAFRAIHEPRANTKKALFYQMFPRNAQNWNTLIVLSPLEHARKRRVLNAAFLDRAIRPAEGLIVNNVDRCGELRFGKGKGEGNWSESENTSVLADQLTFDIMEELSFGRSLGIKEPGENVLKSMPHVMVEYMAYMYALGHSPFLPLFVWLKPRGLDSIMERITPPPVRKFYEFLETNLEQRRLEEVSLEKKGAEQEESRKDLFHHIFKVRDEKGNPGYSEDELAAEAALLVIAGSDTTSTTICGFWFYILRKERCYNKLVAEIRSSFKTLSDIKGGLKLSSCTYLNACINETLRIAPILAGENPRVVLPGGLDINGNHIPAGTQVGVTIEDAARVSASLFPFYFGTGTCAGKKIAMLELRLLIARTLWRYDVRLQPGDTLGAGRKDLPWGLRKGDCYQDVKDAFVVGRDGPNVQFREKVI